MAALTDTPGRLRNPKQAFKTSSKTGWEIFKAQLPQIINSTITNIWGSTTPSATYKVNVPLALDFPTVGVSWQNVPEHIEEKVKSLGFVEDTHGRVRYFRGIPSLGTLESIQGLGPNEKTFVPSGVCDLNGAKAFIVSSRIVQLAFACIPHPADNSDASRYVNFMTRSFRPNDMADEKNTSAAINLPEDIPAPYKKSSLVELVALEERGFTAPVVDISTWRIKNSKECLNYNGVFLPFFPGMTLPDKNFVADFILRLFALNLGTEQRIRRGSSTLPRLPLT